MVGDETPARDGRGRVRRRSTAAPRARARRAAEATGPTPGARAADTAAGATLRPDPAAGAPLRQDDGSRWFLDSSAHPVRPGNHVTAFVDGDGYFADLAAAIRATDGPDAFIELADWDMSTAFELVPGDPTSTLAALLTAAADRGVPVRALLNLHQVNPFGPGTLTGYDNTAAVAFINSLPTGAAIHDDRYLYAGTHHQKIAVIGSAAGLVAYSGGMDLNADRLTTSPGRTRHDVQVRVEGPAAHDHHRLFAVRWSDHPTAPRRPPLPDPGAPPATGRLPAQVVATFGNGSRRPGLAPGAGPTSPGQSFAPTGDRSLQELVLRAIAAARRYVYLEDQYLVNLRVSRALAEALRHLDHLVIVIPGTAEVNGQLLQGWRRRKAFLAPLLDAAPEKVTVCAGERYYVHSKVWVFDDEFAIVGSANCNRRGFTHDSEQAVGVYDPPDDGGWVRELRSRLWAKHLGLPRAALADPLAAAAHWSGLPAGAAVVPYDPDGGSDSPPFPRGTDFIWDSILDPDGS